jgi:exodeoxyribonuclease VII small subunit
MTPPATTTESTAESLTYEQARDELMEIVTRLESGGESLADSMALFQRGELLASMCEEFLAQARTTVEAAKAA